MSRRDWVGPPEADAEDVMLPLADARFVVLVYSIVARFVGLIQD